jgi:hypothetical protein
MHLIRPALISVTALGLVVAACSASDGSNNIGDGGDGGTANSGSGGTPGNGGSTTNANGGATSFNPQGGAGGGTGVICDSGPDEDQDMDGFSVTQGDCNDCDDNVNPGAIEVQTDPMDPEASPADENCDGATDEIFMPCDAGLDIANADPMMGAAAIELCQPAVNGSWGVVNASYVRANGTPAAAGLPTGLIENFGTNVPPRAGQRMLGLSSGNARDASDPGACGSLSCSNLGAGTPPPGFPQDVPSCSGLPNINDDIALEVELIAPTNATGYSFDFRFYSFEYPEWVCTSFNDQFIALVNPAPMGAINGNISFDSMTNPVSVNIAFFDVCAGCPLGTADLAGTGFDIWDDAGATDWLVTTAPVGGGDNVSIRFAIWDTGDTAWDSSALIDNFQWLANAGTVTVGTQPIPQ